MVPIINYLISFIAVPIATRLIFPEEMGKINLIISSAQTILLFVLLGVDQAFFRFYYEQSNQKNKKLLFTFCISISVLVILISSVILYPFAGQISFLLIGTNNKAVYISLVLTVTFSAINRYLTLIFRLEEKPIAYMVQSLLAVLLSRTALIVTGIINPIVEYYIVIRIIQNSLVTLLLIIMNLKKMNFNGMKEFSKDSFRPIFHFALPIAPNNMITSLNNYIINLFIAFKLSYEQLGIYTSAVAIAGTVSVVQVTINLLIGPYILKNYKREDHNFWLIHKVVSYILSLLIVGITMIQPIFLLLLGEKYREASKLFTLLLSSPIFYTITETTYMGFTIMKNNNKRVISSVIALTINALLLSVLYFVPNIDIIYVTVVTAINAFVLMMAQSILGQRLFKTLENYNHIFLVAIVIIICTLINLNIYGIFKFICLFLTALTLTLIYKADIISAYKLIKNNYSH